MEFGLRNKIIDLMQFSFGDGYKNKYKDIENKYNIEIIELKNGEIFENNEIKLTAYDLEHGGCKPILGYVLEKDNMRIGYATDTTLCENVKEICSVADYVFLDATNTIPTKMHMGIEEVVWLAKQFPDKKIYAIHRSDYVHSHISEINFPEDGDVLEI